MNVLLSSPALVDTGERVPVETEEPEYESELGSFFRNMPIGIYHTTADGRILMVNPRLLQMLGYASLSELTTRNLDSDEFEPAYQRAHFKEQLERDGEVKGLESAWTRRDGSVFFARENARAVRGADGAVLYYEGTVEDITERKQAEMERQVIFEIIQGVNTTANLEELLQLVHHALKKVLYAENCFVALYHPSDGLLHMQFFVDEYDAVFAPQAIKKGRTGYVFRTGRPILITAEVFRQLVAQGEMESVGTPPATWVGVPLRTPAEVIGVLVVQHYRDPAAYTLRDLEFLTLVGSQIALAIERKRAEEQLKAFAAKLEQSNRELQDFASVASHDLQEPLRKIQAFGDRLKLKCGGALNEDGHDYLARMQSAAQRMQTLINDLLTFSRVATKAQPFVPVDLAQVAREVVSDLEVRIEQTGGRVELGELPVVEADPLQMRQLLQNLIGNALKFHRTDESPLVRIESRPTQTQACAATANSSGGELCQISVTDNGIGFDEKYLDRIFTVFQRLHGREKYEGTGVGLAVCRRIAERHWGSITAQSAPGQGATFIVTLPVRQSEGERLP